MKRLLSAMLALYLLIGSVAFVFASNSSTEPVLDVTDEKELTAGTHIFLGEKDGKRISWQIVDTYVQGVGKKATLFCDYIMDIVEYGLIPGYSYAGSSMENWCNTFLEGTCFTENERALFTGVARNCGIYVPTRTDIFSFFPQNINDAQRRVFPGVAGTIGTIGLGTVQMSEENYSIWLNSCIGGNLWADVCTWYNSKISFGTTANLNTFKARYGICPAASIVLSNVSIQSGEGTLEEPYLLKFESEQPIEPTKLQLVSHDPHIESEYKPYGKFKDILPIRMTFNFEIQSVQADSGNDFSIIKDNTGEIVYKLSDGNNIEKDVSIAEKTVWIRLSNVNLILGEKYYVHMGNNVIQFKDTSQKIEITGTDWGFIYLPEESSNGFVLGKHSSPFKNSNDVNNYKKFAGFEGIYEHKLSEKAYTTLMSQDSSVGKKLLMSVRLLPPLNQWNGSCHGIASTMLLAFTGDLELYNYVNGIKNYYDMPRPCENADFFDIIEYYQIGQEIMVGCSGSGEKIQIVLKKMIAELDTAPVVFSYKSRDYLHSILAIDYDIDTEGNYSVLMYDMNFFPYWEPAFIKLSISSDFKRVLLDECIGTNEMELDSVSYYTVQSVNSISPGREVSNYTDTTTETAKQYNNIANITVPLSAVSYRIQNAEGQTLICDENGNFSGTMEILDQSGFISGAADGSGSSWTLTVPASERFEVETEQSGINVGIYTEQGCLVLESEDIRSATFVTNQFIRFGQEGQQKFTCVLSNDLPEDQTVRMAYASAETTGSTQIGLEAGDLLISADKTTLEEAARYVGLEKTELDNISTDDGVIYVPVFSDTEDNDQKITVSLGSMTTVLSAKHALTGQICVAGYRENGQLCSVKFYPAAEKITASVDPGAIRAKVFWLDSSRPVCAAKTIMM